MSKEAKCDLRRPLSLRLVCQEYESESEVAQSCPTLCDPVDCSPPGFSVHGILQARILGQVAISFSRVSSRPQGIFPTQGSKPGIGPGSPALEADALTSGPPGKPYVRSVSSFKSYQVGYVQNSTGGTSSKLNFSTLLILSL